MPRGSRRFEWTVAAVLIVACGGTNETQRSRNLTAESAKVLAQTKINTDDDDGQLAVDVSWLTQLVSAKPGFDGYLSDDRIARFLSAKLLERLESKDAIADLTGQFSGFSCGPGSPNCERGSSGVEPVKVVLERENWQLKGTVTFPNSFMNSQCALSGVIHPENEVEVTLSWPAFSFERPRTFTLRIERGDGKTRLVSEGRGRYFDVESGNDKTTQLTVYTFRFTPALEGFRRNDRIRIGAVVVDSVEELLLDGETRANARLKAHADFNAPGKALTGMAGTVCSGTIRFGKQPDGNWVPTEVTIQKCQSL